MKKLVLIGGGGHCKSVLDSVLAMNEFEEIVITDTRIKRGVEICGCRVAGSDTELPKLFKQGFTNAVITVGSIVPDALRKRLADMAENLGFDFPVIYDPTACVSGLAKIGKGTFIGKNAVINADAVIGSHCIINTGSIVEHECKVGDYSHISVGSILCGNVSIGYNSFIGAGSTVIQGISVGNHSVVGANSTVLTNVENQTKVYGIIANESNATL